MLVKIPYDALPPSVREFEVSLQGKLQSSNSQRDKLQACEQALCDAAGTLDHGHLEFDLVRNIVASQRLYTYSHTTLKQWELSRISAGINQEYFELSGKHRQNIERATRQFRQITGSWPWEILPQAQQPKSWSRAILEGFAKLARLCQDNQDAVQHIASRLQEAIAGRVKGGQGSNKRGLSRDTKVVSSDVWKTIASVEDTSSINPLSLHGNSKRRKQFEKQEEPAKEKKQKKSPRQGKDRTEKRDLVKRVRFSDVQRQNQKVGPSAAANKVGDTSSETEDASPPPELDSVTPVKLLASKPAKRNWKPPYVEDELSSEGNEGRTRLSRSSATKRPGSNAKALEQACGSDGSAAANCGKADIENTNVKRNAHTSAKSQGQRHTPRSSTRGSTSVRVAQPQESSPELSTMEGAASLLALSSPQHNSNSTPSQPLPSSPSQPFQGTTSESPATPQRQPQAPPHGLPTPDTTERRPPQSQAKPDFQASPTPLQRMLTNDQRPGRLHPNSPLIIANTASAAAKDRLAVEQAFITSVKVAKNEVCSRLDHCCQLLIPLSPSLFPPICDEIKYLSRDLDQALIPLTRALSDDRNLLHRMLEEAEEREKEIRMGGLVWIITGAWLRGRG